MFDPDKFQHLMTVKFIDGVTLAKKCGVTKTTIYNLKAGRTQPKPSTFRAICEVLECDPEDLLKDGR